MPRDDRPQFRKSSKFSKSPSGRSAYGPPKKKFGRPGGRKTGPKRTGADDDVTPEGVRLQKVMAAAGVGSRRHCEELIAEGRVQINGTTARLGDRVPEGATVTVDGEALRVASRTVYYLVNKPDGVVSTNYDQSGRTRVVDLVPQADREHLFTVGRLDLSSEGLILVTNDGELANRLTHPKFGVEKTYAALVAGRPEPAVYQKLRQGVHLAEGVARCVSVYVKKELPQSTLLEIVLNEGKNREIRRILAKVGHKVLTLKRIAIGEVTMKGLKVGEFRPLTPYELKSLRESTGKQRRRPQEPARPVDEAELMAAAKPPVAEDDEATTDAPRREGRGDARPPRGKFGRDAEGGREGRPRREGQGDRGGRPAFQSGPKFGKPRPQRTVLGGGAHEMAEDGGDGERRPPRGKRFGDRCGGAQSGGGRKFGGGGKFDRASGGGRPPFAKDRPPRADREADHGDEGESLGAHPSLPSGGRPQTPSTPRGDAKKFRRKRRPTPMFPKRKKRD
jgi:23S rRNA pseudouridine2605 synthase